MAEQIKQVVEIYINPINDIYEYRSLSMDIKRINSRIEYSGFGVMVFDKEKNNFKAILKKHMNEKLPYILTVIVRGKKQTKELLEFIHDVSDKFVGVVE